MLTLRWGSATDVGRVRELNEDSLLTAPPLFAVADGMGGHAAGEVASDLAVSEFRRLAEFGPLRPEDISAAIWRANEHIVTAGAERGDRFPMGTTLTGIAAVTADDEDQWAVFNVGDSRIYRFADGLLSQLSVDHSAVQELVDAGQLTREQARVHPRRNVVTRSLGSDPAPVPDVWVFPPVVGERFLICSDGLSTEVEDVDIAGVLRDVPDPELAAQALVDLAVRAGGRDNVTTVVIDVAEA